MTNKVSETGILDFSEKVAPYMVPHVLRPPLPDLHSNSSLRAALYEKPRLSKSYEKLPKVLGARGKTGRGDLP